MSERLRTAHDLECRLFDELTAPITNYAKSHDLSMDGPPPPELVELSKHVGKELERFGLTVTKFGLAAYDRPDILDATQSSEDEATRQNVMQQLFHRLRAE